MARDDFDFDWLVIGSGFGGSVSALRLAEKGHSRRRARVRAALRRRRVRQLDGRSQALLLESARRDEGDLPADDVQGRLGRLRLRRRRRQPRLREHAVRAAEGLLRGPPVGRDGRLGERARAPLRRSAADARRRAKTRTRTPPTSCCASSARSSASATRYKRTPVGVFFGEPGQDRRRPVLRRRGARAHRLPAVRALHGRLPARRQEHARQELPVLRREARRARDARTHRDRHPPARRGRRQRRLRGRKRALGRVAAQGTPRPARARRGRLGRPAGHEQAAAALPRERLAAGDLRAPGRARAHQLASRSSRSPCPRTTPRT